MEPMEILSEHQDRNNVELDKGSDGNVEHVPWTENCREKVQNVIDPSGEENEFDLVFDEYGREKHYRSNTTSPSNVFFKHFFQDEDFLDIASRHGSQKYYFFIEPCYEDEGFPLAKPFWLKKEIEKNIINRKNLSVRYTASKSLLFETANVNTAKEILKITSMFNILVRVQMVRSNMISKFLLYDIPVEYLLNDIAAELEEENGLYVWQLRRFSKGEKPSGMVLVTTIGVNIPSEISFWYQNQKITRFIDSPQWCKKCHLIGHGKNKCTDLERCENCGVYLKHVHPEIIGESVTHDQESCKNLKCRNCNSEHDPHSKDCPVYIFEKKVRKISLDNHIPTFEARRLMSIDKNKKSIAKVVRSSTSNFVTKEEFMAFGCHLTEDLELQINKKFEDHVTKMNSQLCSLFSKISEMSNIGNLVTIEQFNSKMNLMFTEIAKLMAPNQNIVVPQREKTKASSSNVNPRKKKAQMSQKVSPNSDQTIIKPAILEWSSLKEDDSKSSN